MRSRGLAVAFLLSVVWSADAQRVTCESPNNQYRECRVASSGVIRLLFDMSFGTCQEGVTWGTHSAGVVWIDRGCRGVFTVDKPRHTPPALIVCESVDGEVASCRADTTRGVYLARQLSRNLCIQGKTWGFDPERGTIWVGSGCRAEFGFGERPADLPPPTVLDHILVCESADGRRQECAADTSGGVQLVSQLASTTCLFGKHWGYDPRGIWVSKGCRAVFAVRTPRPVLQTIVCESKDGRRSHCPAPTRPGVALARVLGEQPCVLDTSWGFDGDGVWVDGGCRAQFALGGFRIAADAVPASASRLFCESVDGTDTRCEARTGRGVALVRQISDVDCVLNRNWGYDATGIWVTAGCRAEFVVAR